MRKVVAEFLEIGEKSYYVWKNKSHKTLIEFLEQYFDESDLREYMDTGKMEKLENSRNDDYQKIDEHILFYSMKKVHEIPNLFLLGKKEFWLEGFIQALKNSKTYNKNELMRELLNLDQKFYEAKKWKKITVEWINNNLSELEVELLLKNKDRVIRELS